MDQLRAILTPAEIRLLAAYLFDHRTQRELARAKRRGQSTIGRRLRKAVAKLQQQGLSVEMRRRGRRRKVRAAPLSQLMHRLDDTALLNGAGADRESE